MEDFDAGQAIRDVIRRDHECTIAVWQAKADACAAEGDEERRAWYQEFVDDLRGIALPWERAG
jgi:hypothetical protein